MAVCEGKMLSNDIISGTSDNALVASDVPLRDLLPSFLNIELAYELYPAITRNGWN